MGKALYVVLMLYGLIGIGVSIEKIINPDEPAVAITPKTVDNRMTETFWKLKAPKGSKLVIGCVLHAADKNEAYIQIDTGKHVIYHFPENEISFKNISHKNIMGVTLKNFGSDPLMSCKVRATKPYTQLTLPNIDSSEFGRIKLSKNNLNTKGCRCGWSNKNLKRIFGGEKTGVNEFPFVAILKRKMSGSFFCGGTIITSRHVLTAAHCLFAVKNIDIIVDVGEHDLRTENESPAKKTMEVFQKIIHEEYHHSLGVNDIGMIVLKNHIAFTDKVGPICMPAFQQFTPPGTTVRAIGWGLTKDIRKGGSISYVLRKVNLQVVDPDICKLIYDHNNAHIHLCTYHAHHDYCNGDSGGPLVAVNQETMMYYLAGVISYGNRCGSTNPSVSTYVVNYLQWIKDTIDETVPLKLCY